MANRRQAKLNEQIRRELSEILRSQVRDPRIGLPTVTGVRVTPDLWMARVFVRPDPTRSDVELDEVLEGLERAAPFIRRELGRSLQTRRTPELRFERDTALERANRIERILNEVLPPEGRRPDDDGEVADRGIETDSGSDAEGAPDAGNGGDA